MTNFEALAAQTRPLGVCESRKSLASSLAAAAAKIWRMAGIKSTPAYLRRRSSSDAKQESPPKRGLERRGSRITGRLAAAIALMALGACVTSPPEDPCAAGSAAGNRAGECAPPLDSPPETPRALMSELESQRQEEEPDHGIPRLRFEAMRNTAIIYGVQSGLRRRNWEIEGSLKRKADKLALAFDFKRVAAEAPEGMGYVIPPVVTRAFHAYESDASGEEVAAADEYLRIKRRGKISSAVPTWREYLLYETPPPHEPPEALMPENDIERELWDSWVEEGWGFGVRQADNEIADRLERLGSDYRGMQEYRRLVSHGMIERMVLDDWDFGVTGGKDVMRIGSRNLRIVRHAEFRTDPATWTIPPDAFGASPDAVSKGRPPGLSQEIYEMRESAPLDGAAASHLEGAGDPAAALAGQAKALDNHARAAADRLAVVELGSSPASASGDSKTGFYALVYDETVSLVDGATDPSLANVTDRGDGFESHDEPAAEHASAAGKGFPSALTRGDFEMGDPDSANQAANPPLESTVDPAVAVAANRMDVFDDHASTVAERSAPSGIDTQPASAHGDSKMSGSTSMSREGTPVLEGALDPRGYAVANRSEVSENHVHAVAGLPDPSGIDTLPVSGQGGSKMSGSNSANQATDPPLESALDSPSAAFPNQEEEFEGHGHVAGEHAGVSGKDALSSFTPQDFEAAQDDSTASADVQIQESEEGQGIQGARCDSPAHGRVGSCGRSPPKAQFPRFPESWENGRQPEDERLAKAPISMGHSERSQQHKPGVENGRAWPAQEN